MPWREIEDPDNAENGNAGNGGDLVKHTVYLAVLDYLLARSPWSAELRVRECHAGRGMYRIPNPATRRRLLTCLFGPGDIDVEVPLHDLQRATQTALDVWPAQLDDFEWYSGSAVLNAWVLGQAVARNHLLDLYEQAPATRAVLRAVLAAPALENLPLQVTIRPEPENNLPFDGEVFIEHHVSEWDERDLILLDPFAMWRQPGDAPRRNRYRLIVDALIAQRERSPSLILFWTWGRNFPVADADLAGNARKVANGYRDLRYVLHQADRGFIRISWRWGLQFAMWVLVPQRHLVELRDSIQQHCDQLTLHLGGRRCNRSPIDVIIDQPA